MGPMNKLLLDLIRQYQLDYRAFQIIYLRDMVEKGKISESMAMAHLSELEPLIRATELRGNFLFRPPWFSGEWNTEPSFDVELGDLLEAQGLRFGIRLRRVKNIIIVGATGTGKTNAMRRIIQTVSEYNHRNPTHWVTMIIIDLKNDYMDRDFLLGSEGLLFSAHHGLHLGFNPPPDVGLETWFSFLAVCLAAPLNLIAARVTVLRMLNFLTPLLNVDSPELLQTPTPQNLRELTALTDLNCFSAKADYGKWLIQGLDGLIEDSGDLFSSHGLDLVRDVISQKQKHAIIDLSNLAVPVRRLAIYLLIGQVLIHRLATRYKCDRTEVMFMIGESELVTNQNAELQFPDGFSPLGLLARLGREMGLQLTVELSALQNTAPHILINAGSRIIYNLTDSYSIAQALQALLLDSRSDRMLASLNPGECLFLESQSNWPHTIWCKTDYVPPARNVANLHYDTHPTIMGQNIAEIPRVMQAIEDLRKTHRQNHFRQKETTGDKATARKLLSLASLYPYVPVVYLWKIWGQKISPGLQASIRKELEDSKLAAFEEVRIGSSTYLLMEILPDGWQLLEMNSPQKPGRGGIAHRHFCRWIQLVREKEGFKVSTEWIAPGTNHPVDLCIQKDGQNQVYEILATCTDNVLSHLRACLIQSDRIDTVILVAPQKKVLEQVHKDIEMDLEVSFVLNRVTFETIDRHLKGAMEL